MKRILLTSLFLVAVSVLTPTNAQDLFVEPGLYAVTGVASNDSLNIRSEPNANAEIIGEFGYTQTNIEVIATSSDGNWGLVNSEDQSGWTAMRFLRLMPDQPTADLPNGLSCSGNEPFWNLDFHTSDQVIGNWSYMGMSDLPTIYGDAWSARPVNNASDTIGFDLTGQPITASGIIQTQMCEDGMSLRAYGYSINAILNAGAVRILVTGCCSLGRD